jgi:CBS domain-containing protein
MATGVTTVTEDTPARDVAHLMHARNIKRVPVVRDGKLVGIVARSDLVRALAQKLEEQTAASETGVATPNEALRHRRDQAGR